MFQNKKTTKDQMVEYRNTKVCHPANSGKEFGEGEEWIVPYTLRVPITCGRYAILHHDILAGAVGKNGEIVINTDGWKAPSLRDAINEHVLPSGWEIKSDWFLVTPTDKFPVVDNMRLDSHGNLQAPGSDEIDKWADRLRNMPPRINYYIQHVFDLMKRDLVGRGPDENVSDADRLEDQINNLVVSRYLLNDVSQMFTVNKSRPSKELRDALDGYIRTPLGLPLEV